MQSLMLEKKKNRRSLPSLAASFLHSFIRIGLPTAGLRIKTRGVSSGIVPTMDLWWGGIFSYTAEPLWERACSR
nr:hypothetical protein C1892_26550 [Pseudomonas sp. MPBD7-1]